jgi:hypothetical protein
MMPLRLCAKHASSLAALVSLLVLMEPAARAAAPLPHAVSCGAAIALTEPGSHLPPHLLAAIALVESGRTDPGTGATAPWPWTIDVAGAAHVFDSEAAAVAAVQAAQLAGIQSIDVGCMQVNLLHHPHAFANLEEAFDPAANVRYAARFLTALHAQSGDWAQAIAAYHSATPELGAAYAQRVAATWPLAARFGLTADGGSKALAEAALEAEVDPNRVLTPQFRAEMVAAAALRHEQEAALQGAAPTVAVVARAPAAPVGSPAKGRAGTLSTAALEAEVDPKHVLTPEFRAQMMAAAAFRHRQAAALRGNAPSG